MKRAVSNKIVLLSVFCLAITAFALYSPMVCHGEEYELAFDFSPNIINISSERWGDIRILTGMRYSFFVGNGHSISLYFNDSPESVQNIRATRDSLGNLILRFSIDDLLMLKDYLLSDAFNDAVLVITMTNEDEYTGEGQVYINDKKAP